MKIEIGDLKVDLYDGSEFKQIITYIESNYATKAKEVGVDYASNHVFDDEQSVRWNREKVEESNLAKRTQRDQLRLEKLNMYDKMNSYLQSYIADYLADETVSLDFANTVRTCLRSWHDYEWPDYLDEYLELLKAYKKELVEK